MLNVALQCRGTETALEANAEYMGGAVESRERKVSNLYFFPQNRYGHASGCVWDSTAYPWSACMSKCKFSRLISYLYQLK